MRKFAGRAYRASKQAAQSLKAASAKTTDAVRRGGQGVVGVARQIPKIPAHAKAASEFAIDVAAKKAKWPFEAYERRRERKRQARAAALAAAPPRATSKGWLLWGVKRTIEASFAIFVIGVILLLVLRGGENQSTRVVENVPVNKPTQINGAQMTEPPTKPVVRVEPKLEVEKPKLPEGLKGAGPTLQYLEERAKKGSPPSSEEPPKDEGKLGEAAEPKGEPAPNTIAAPAEVVVEQPKPEVVVAPVVKPPLLRSDKPASKPKIVERLLASEDKPKSTGTEAQKIPAQVLTKVENEVAPKPQPSAKVETPKAAKDEPKGKTEQPTIKPTEDKAPAAAPQVSLPPKGPCPEGGFNHEFEVCIDEASKPYLTSSLIAQYCAKPPNGWRWQKDHLCMPDAAKTFAGENVCVKCGFLSCFGSDPIEEETGICWNSGEPYVTGQMLARYCRTTPKDWYRKGTTLCTKSRGQEMCVPCNGSAS